MKPNSSRTGTTRWRKIRAQRLKHDFDNGVTNCPICNVQLDYEYSLRPNSAEPDHIIPFSQTKDDSFDNTRTICRLCNQRLGAKLGHKKQADKKRRVKPTTKIAW